MVVVVVIGLLGFLSNDEKEAFEGFFNNSLLFLDFDERPRGTR